ncbi:had-superfamily hydrolase subfamily ia, variant 3 [Gracilibacillus halophilus YIM-C55.5]|uniref:Had-superfamily hydrolase subfamily ia, variant 3 n=1 Tax=Gracilibacillus halophilus YIM-C55.5 TaxID=1308866 RepID=N4WYH0_9BACI|nr:HAD family phosphatase [Gracilibacillus halophilus]ENH98071.1 had-superfamily hydrolase subfamily ia, variant 3 [Gracilibacillus halophilus YIM-C55.5]
MEVTIGSESYQAEGLLFDKDGTIIDFYSLWGQWGHDIIQDIYKKLNQDIYFHPHQMSQFIGLDIPGNTWDPKGPLAISGTNELMTILTLYLYQKQIPWNDAYTYVTDSFEKINANLNWSDFIKPIEGIQEFMKHAHQSGLKIAVVTSDSTSEANKHLDILGLKQYIDCVIGHDLVERGKPFHDMADLACCELGIDNQQALMFGDSNSDMQLVKNADMKAGIGVSAQKNSTHLEDANLIIQNYRNCYI